MITLLLDSSSSTLAVSLARNRVLIATHLEAAFQTQSELLTLRISEILKAHKISVQEISEIAVTFGPGSFTGVRIAVTIAKVMAYALNVPLYKISSLAVYKHETRPTICVLDARNGRSFAGVYEGNKTLMRDTIMTNIEVLQLAKTNNYLIAGETKHLNLVSANYNHGENMLSQISEESKVLDIKAFKPIYLKG